MIVENCIRMHMIGNTRLVRNVLTLTQINGLHLTQKWGLLLSVNERIILALYFYKIGSQVEQIGILR